MFDVELETAQTLARQAGEVILEFYAKEIIAEEKLGIDNFYEPVTEADKEASRLIVDGLAAKFPEDATLSEEERDDSEHRLSKRRSWIIDPIDGTAGFVKKDGDFGVQIGLAEEGEPILGVVYLPVHDLMYYAAAGKGAFSVTGDATPKRLEVSEKTDFAEMDLAITRNHWSEKMARVIDEFRFRRQVRRGSVGLKVGLIAEQVCDIYIHTTSRTKLWDTCAPQIILEEAGGCLTDLFGYPITYDVTDLQNHNGILATNAAAHKAAVERMRPLLAEFDRLRVVNTKKAPAG